jgi:hypothetical protein
MDDLPLLFWTKLAFVIGVIVDIFPERHGSLLDVVVMRDRILGGHGEMREQHRVLGCRERGGLWGKKTQWHDILVICVSCSCCGPLPRHYPLPSTMGYVDEESSKKSYRGTGNSSQSVRLGPNFLHKNTTKSAVNTSPGRGD